MIRTDAQFSEAVARKVTEIEKVTDAEVVVVAAKCSGTYRDLALAAASVASLATYGVLLVVPFQVSPILAMADLVGVWGLVGWWLSTTPLVARLARAERRRRQVRTAAAAEFHLEAVHSTPRRIGLLVYLSVWEGLVEVIPDAGVDARIPRGELGVLAARFDGTSTDGFLASLDALGKALAERLPASEEPQLELADAPRIR